MFDWFGFMLKNVGKIAIRFDNFKEHLIIMLQMCYFKLKRKTRFWQDLPRSDNIKWDRSKERCNLPKRIPHRQAPKRGTAVSRRMASSKQKKWMALQLPTYAPTSPARRVGVQLHLLICRYAYMPICPYEYIYLVGATSIHFKTLAWCLIMITILT